MSSERERQLEARVAAQDEEIIRLREVARCGEQIILLFFRNRDLLAYGSTMQYEVIPELSRLLRNAGFRDAATLEIDRFAAPTDGAARAGDAALPRRDGGGAT